MAQHREIQECQKEKILPESNGCGSAIRVPCHTGSVTAVETHELRGLWHCLPHLQSEREWLCCRGGGGRADTGNRERVGGREEVSTKGEASAGFQLTNPAVAADAA